MKALFRRLRRFFRRKPNPAALAQKTMAYHKIVTEALVLAERIDQNRESILAHAGDIRTLEDFKIIKEDFRLLKKKHKTFAEDIQNIGEAEMLIILAEDLPNHDMKDVEEHLDRNMKTLYNFVGMMNHVIGCTGNDEGCK